MDFAMNSGCTAGENATEHIRSVTWSERSVGRSLPLIPSLKFGKGMPLAAVRAAYHLMETLFIFLTWMRNAHNTCMLCNHHYSAFLGARKHISLNQCSPWHRRSRSEY